MPAPAQTLPTVVPEEFDEGAIKDPDSDTDPSVAASEPDLAESWLGVSDPDLALPESAPAAANQDCRYVAGSLSSVALSFTIFHSKSQCLRLSHLWCNCPRCSVRCCSCLGAFAVETSLLCCAARELRVDQTRQPRNGEPERRGRLGRLPSWQCIALCARSPPSPAGCSAPAVLLARICPALPLTTSRSAHLVVAHTPMFKHTYLATRRP